MAYLMVWGKETSLQLRGNSHYIFCTVVSEVSSFVDDPVTLIIFIGTILNKTE